MSYYSPGPVYASNGSTPIRSFVPNYQPRSDYLPGVVQQGSNATTASLLRQYEEEKRRGRVVTQKPVQFNPKRYVSYCTRQNVFVDRPIDQDHFSRVARR